MELGGFQEEIPQTVLFLMMEEIGELVKAIHKHTGMKLDVQRQEDCPE